MWWLLMEPSNQIYVSYDKLIQLCDRIINELFKDKSHKYNIKHDGCIKVRASELYELVKNNWFYYQNMPPSIMSVWYKVSNVCIPYLESEGYKIMRTSVTSRLGYIICLPESPNGPKRVSGKPVNPGGRL